MALLDFIVNGAFKMSESRLLSIALAGVLGTPSQLRFKWIVKLAASSAVAHAQSHRRELKNAVMGSGGGVVVVVVVVVGWKISMMN